MKKNIFITGISGCVGHYIFDLLADRPEYQVYALVRYPHKLKFNPQAYSNLTIIQDDLKDIRKHADILKNMDYVIHLATEWGDFNVNDAYSVELFNLLDPHRCKKVIYFSTASILDSNNQPLPEAKKFGTHYIQSKYNFFQKLPGLKIYPKVITLFPTWVLGGDVHHPFSHASAGILEMQKWLWLIRFLTVDASFHFVHARDLAQIAIHLLKNETKEKNFVLGNQALTVSQFLKETCRFLKKRIYFQIPVSLTLIRILAALSRRKLHSWDLFCFKKRYFTHKTVNAEYFGLSSNLQSVEQILQNLTQAKPV